MTGLTQVFLCGFCVITNMSLCPDVSVKAVYSELHHTLMSIDEQDDLKWWKNNRGPGMPTNWPKIEVRFLFYPFNLYSTREPFDLYYHFFIRETRPKWQHKICVT